MTNEEAIAWFKNAVPKNCLECPKEHDYSCSYANSLRCEAYMLARIALRGQMERKRGKAVRISEDIDSNDTLIRMDRQCNQCGALITHTDNFCPHCGADMRGAKHEAD